MPSRLSRLPASRRPSSRPGRPARGTGRDRGHRPYGPAGPPRRSARVPARSARRGPCPSAIPMVVERGTRRPDPVLGSQRGLQAPARRRNHALPGWSPAPRRDGRAAMPRRPLAPPAARLSRHRSHSRHCPGCGLQAEADSAEQVARGKRLSGAGRVDRLRRGGGVHPAALPDTAGTQLHHELAVRQVADQCRLRLVAEDHRGAELPEQVAEPADPVAAQGRRGGEIDISAAAPWPPRRSRLRHRSRDQAVGRQVQPRAVIEPPGFQDTTVQLRADPAVGQHRPRGAPLGERDHHSGPARQYRPDEIDAAVGQLGGDKTADHIANLRGDQPGPAAQAQTQAATLAACPPTPTEVTAVVSVSSANGSASRTTTST